MTINFKDLDATIYVYCLYLGDLIYLGTIKERRSSFFDFNNRFLILNYLIK